MERMAQLVLDLDYRASLDGADFFVADCNAAAVAMIDGWPAWTSHAQALVGPAGAGKTHLASVWMKRSGAISLAPEDIGARSRVMMQRPPAALIEDIDRALADGRADPVDLFHLYNWLNEGRGYLLFTARTPPSRWEIALPDLRSRLRSMPVTDIGAPDETLIAALLVKQLGDRQLRIPPRVVDYIAPRIERSFAAVEAMATRLDTLSLERKRPLSISLARAALDSLHPCDD